MRFFFCTSLLVLCCSCDQIMYHPDEIRPAERDLNAKNIQKINALSPKDSFQFVLVGDTQRFYDELDAFIAHVNALDNISFVLINGDIVDFGLNREYNWVASKLARLKVPYVTTIGNHDMIANGRKIYQEMFGPENFIFDYSGSRFICLNTNSRETGFDGTIPDMNWLKQQLADDSTCKNIFLLSHVPPFSPDFDRKREFEFRYTLRLNPKTRLSLHGHNHYYEVAQPYGDGLRYVVAGAGNQRNYALIGVNGEQCTVDEKYY